jgi:hypothetical protein
MIACQRGLFSRRPSTLAVEICAEANPEASPSKDTATALTEINAKGLSRQCICILSSLFLSFTKDFYNTNLRSSLIQAEAMLFDHT